MASKVGSSIEIIIGVLVITSVVTAANFTDSTLAMLAGLFGLALLAYGLMGIFKGGN